MGEVFGAAYVTLAFQYALKRKHSDFLAEPFDPGSPAVFGGKRCKTVNPIDEIHEGAIVKRHHGSRKNLGTQFLAETEYEHVFPLGEIDPDICVKRGGWCSLQNRRRHAGDLKPNLVLSETLNKPCDRRKF